MKELSIGKIRGLTQIAGKNGTFTMCAMDHRGSFRSMINAKNPDAVTSEEITRRKLELCESLGGYASAVLLDPIWGAAQCIAGGVLPAQTGLLVSIEESGYTGGKESRLTTLLPGWGVEKIRRLGAQAVKMLAYYRPDLKNLAGKQQDIIRAVADDCTKHDIPFLLEAVSYPVGKEVSDAVAFAGVKGELVIGSARDITALPVDVLKAEFPADMRYEQDQGVLKESCRRLDEASQRPWVLLSQGVDFDVFARQVEIACQAGASGFLGGRAIWKEVMAIEDARDRMKFLSTTALDRLKKISDIAAKYGVPWYRKLGLSSSRLATITENWYQGY
ncbi:MAG: tagatose 1,6-diphosphate aldolase [Chloroflexota bacterium]